MTTTHDPDTEAADWFATRKLAKDREIFDPAFQAWLHDSEHNREAYRRVEHAWGVIQQMKSLGLFEPVADGLGPSAAPSATNQAESVQPAPQAPPTARGRTLTKAAALASLVILSILALVRGLTHDKAVSPLPPLWVTYETGRYDSIASVIVQAAQIGDRVKIEEPLATADDEQVAWLQDKWVFSPAEPLWKIVRKFNRYNSQQLKIIDPRIADVMLGGIVDKHDPESFEFGLSQLHIQYVVSESQRSHSRVFLLSRQRP
jgi:ferric-dicitrate binding protein FerR (iron transport regulator)